MNNIKRAVFQVLARCQVKNYSEGLMKIPTWGNTEDKTHLGLPQARRGINCVRGNLWFHWVYIVHSTATVNRLGEGQV